MKKKPSPFSEVNFLPSATRIAPLDGAAQRMQNQPVTPHFNGLTKEQVQDLKNVRSHDPIDAFGIAQAEMRKAVGDYKSGSFHTAFMKSLNNNKK